MFSISIEVNLPEFDKIPIEVPCPICELHTWVTLGSIRRRDFAICRGCHTNILLEDHLGSVHRTIKNIEGVFKDIGF